MYYDLELKQRANYFILSLDWLTNALKNNSISLLCLLFALLLLILQHWWLNSNLFQRCDCICNQLIFLLDLCLPPLFLINQTFKLELLGIMEIWQEFLLLILEDTHETHRLECKICLQTVGDYFHELLELAKLICWGDPLRFLDSLEVFLQLFHEKDLKLLFNLYQLFLYTSRLRLILPL